MNPVWGIENLIPEVSFVIDTVIGRTAMVRKILPGFGVQVWVKERGYERENWPWANLTIRSPRLIKRWPRPFRFPREVPSEICHCKIGRMEVENVEERAVRCQRCKYLVAYESFPNRIERATIMLRKADRPVKVPKENNVQKRVSRRRKRKARSRGNHSLKAGKNKSRVVIRSTRRNKNAKSKATNRVKRKNNPKVSKTRQRRRRTKKVSKARKTKK